nr:hypothetical protein BACY1_07510 [Tenacibaculum mesophilum]
MRNQISKHLYLAIFILPIITLIIVNTFNIGEANESYLKNITYSIVGIGVFSGFLKYINTLFFVKKHFEEIILSNGFEEILNKKFEFFIFSNRYLESISEAQLKKNWKRITYFKYEQKFPTLWNRMNLKQQIFNYYFEDDVLEFYYKNFRVTYDLYLTSCNKIKIIETADFTLVSNDTNEKKFSFWVEDKNSKIDKNKTIIDSKSLNQIKDEEDTEVLNIDENDDEIKMTITLKGKNEYQIEKVIEMNQDYDEDRTMAFSTSKIIDDLFVKVRVHNNLKAYFHSTLDVEFDDDNLNNCSISKKNRKIILPGEVFVIFIDKTC